MGLTTLIIPVFLCFEQYIRIRVSDGPKDAMSLH